MKMDDNELKRILQAEMNREADRIWDEVNSDPEVRDAVAPEDMFDDLMEQIRATQAAEANKFENLSPENQEWIRLGKIYQKKRSRRKYYVLLVAVACLLAFGITSFGDAEKVFQEVKDMIAGKEQINIDSNGERTAEVKTVDEAEAYEEIEEEFGFLPVKMYYLPEGMDFVEIIVDENLQSAHLCYADKEGRTLSYYITTNYRDGSVSTEVEDKFIQEYEKEINGVVLKMQEYLIEEEKMARWVVNFVYKETRYSMLLTGVEKEEVEEIIESLYFS